MRWGTIGARGKRAVLLSAGALVACFAFPTTASAARNCCFELDVHNDASYTIDYHNDGYGYDGQYSYKQIWEVQAIISYSDRGRGTLRNRGARSRIGLGEYSSLTRCAMGNAPCFNREPIDCEGATYHPPSAASPGYFGHEEISAHTPGGNASIGRGGDLAWLYALPPDDVYYSVDRVGCDGGHGHHGWGEAAEGYPGASDRSVSLKPPNKQFMRTAGEGDRCSYRFESSLSLDDSHSQTPGGHAWGSYLFASYRLSYFPKSRIDEERQRLEDLGQLSFPTTHSWGKRGTGDRTC